MAPFSTSPLSSKVRPEESDTSDGRKIRLLRRQPQAGELVEPILQVQQTIESRFTRAVDYKTYRLNDQSQRYADSVSHYIPKIVKDLQPQMKAHMIDSADQKSILVSLNTFKLAGDANRIHGGAAMWVMPYFVSSRIEASPNSRMIKSDGTAVEAAIITPNGLA